MHIFSRSTLQQFWKNHPDSEESLKSWFKEAEHASWQSFDDIKKRYSSADVLRGNRVVFNIKGNKYRLVVQLHYNKGMIFIRFVGTHAEYDRIDAEAI